MLQYFTQNVNRKNRLFPNFCFKDAEEQAEYTAAVFRIFSY